MRFNRKQFFDGFRTSFGRMTTQQVTGLERLLSNIENDPHIPTTTTGLYWVAYILATVKRETAHTFTPIHEYGSKKYFISRYGGHTRKGRELGNDTPEEGYDYAGKGDVQTTGEANYEKAEVALRYEYPELVEDFERRTGKTFDLTVGDQPSDKTDPQNILDPAISYAVMSYGMRTGMFTGRKLGHYTGGREPNYLGMRAVVNGNDHAEEIAGDARKFEKILKAALEDEEINAIIDSIGNPVSAEVLPADVPATPTAEDVHAVEPTPTGTDTTGLQPQEQPPTQIAENIINNDSQPVPFVPETLTMEAPAKDGATTTATKATFLGFAIPGSLYLAFETVSQWVKDGVIDIKQILDPLIGLIRDNIRYIPYLVGFIVSVVVVKKAFKQITFLVQMVINASPRMHNIQIVPFVAEEREKRFYQFWK